MTTSEPQGYGLWALVFINAAVFIIFAFSFYKPKTSRDWRSFGAFSAFIVALFTEMYGFPLTIYLLSGWLSSRYPGLNLDAHNTGHLWNTLLGLQGDPHFNFLHILSEILLLPGSSWLVQRGKSYIPLKKRDKWLPQVPMRFFGILNTSVSYSSCSDFYFNGRRSWLQSCFQFWYSCTRAWPKEKKRMRWQNLETPIQIIKKIFQASSHVSILRILGWDRNLRLY